MLQNKGDMLTTYIAPYTDKAVVVLGGLGDKLKVPCCPCTIAFICNSSSLGPLKKSITGVNNWISPHRSKLKRLVKSP